MEEHDDVTQSRVKERSEDRLTPQVGAFIFNGVRARALGSLPEK
jgi:hypothetical protein